MSASRAASTLNNVRVTAQCTCLRSKTHARWLLLHQLAHCLIVFRLSNACHCHVTVTSKGPPYPLTCSVRIAFVKARSPYKGTLAEIVCFPLSVCRVAFVITEADIRYPVARCQAYSDYRQCGPRITWGEGEGAF